MKRWMNIEKDLWILRENASSSALHQKKLSLTSLQQLSMTKKAREKFIKGPLKLQMVLETIEQNNYNREYGDKKTNKKHRKLQLESSSSEEQVAYTHPAQKRKIDKTGKKKISNRNCHFCGKPNWSLEHNCPARRAQCNNCKKMGHFAKVCKSKTVNRVQKEPSTATPSHGPKLTISNPSTA